MNLATLTEAPPEPTLVELRDYYHQIAGEHALLRLLLSGLTGAAKATLLAIEEAGGWQADTPANRERIAVALKALARATEDALNSRMSGLPVIQI